MMNTQFFSQLLKNAGCIYIDTNLVAAIITVLGTLAGIWLKHRLEAQKSRPKRLK